MSTKSKENRPQVRLSENDEVLHIIGISLPLKLEVKYNRHKSPRPSQQEQPQSKIPGKTKKKTVVKSPPIRKQSIPTSAHSHYSRFSHFSHHSHHSHLSSASSRGRYISQPLPPNATIRDVLFDECGYQRTNERQPLPLAKRPLNKLSRKVNATNLGETCGGTNKRRGFSVWHTCLKGGKGKTCLCRKHLTSQTYPHLFIQAKKIDLNGGNRRSPCRKDNQLMSQTCPRLFGAHKRGTRCNFTSKTLPLLCGSSVASDFSLPPKACRSTRSNPLQRLLSSASLIPCSICQKKLKTVPPPKQVKSYSLVDRNSMSQKEYMTMLSQPRTIKCQPNKCVNCRPGHKTCDLPNCEKCQQKTPPKLEKCCRFDVLSPRLQKISLPNKNQVLANWQRYQHVLSPERLQRFEELLRSGEDHLELGEAIRFFDHMKKNRCKPTPKKCKCPQKWLQNQVNMISDVIVNYFLNKPPKLLNFPDMIISDEILNWLERKKVISSQCKCSNNSYKKTIVDICDKVVTWVDELNCFIDLKPLTSQEKILLDKFSFESLVGDEVEEEVEWYDEEEEEEESESYEDEGESSDSILEGKFFPSGEEETYRIDFSRNEFLKMPKSDDEYVEGYSTDDSLDDSENAI